MVYINYKKGMIKMVRRKTANIIIFTFLFLSIFVYRAFLIQSVLKYAEIILTSILLIVTAIAVLSLGFQKNKNNFIKNSILMVTITHIILYFAITYAIGIFTGFLKNSYSLSNCTNYLYWNIKICNNQFK